MAQSISSGIPTGIPAGFPLAPSPQTIVDQQVSVETKTPEATHSTEQSIENQIQQRLKAESEPTEVTFSQEALSQIKAWGSLKFNAGTDKEPKLITFNPAKIEQARIAVLDRDGDKQISVEELSLNGDKIATKKEFEFLLNQGIETFQRENSR